MNHVRPTARILRSYQQRTTPYIQRPFSPRHQQQQQQQQQQRRTFAAEPPSPHPPSSPPNPNSQPPKEPSRVGAYYGTFGSPILKCFLGALFTYQVAYYAWLKLETMEETHDQQSEIASLQDELRRAVEERRDKVEGAVAEVKDKVVEGVEEVGKSTEVVGKVAKGGWWPW